MSEGNGFVTRDALFAVGKRRFREFEVDGVGKFRIRSLSESERAHWEAPNLTKKGEINLEKVKDTRLRAIIWALVDGEGRTILTIQDIGTLREWDSGLVSKLYTEIAEHCGLDKDGVASAEKNSEPIPADASQ